MTPPTVYQGSCLCGNVTFNVTNLERRAGHCHCSMCRKFHGAAFATLASVRVNDLNWLSGEELVSGFRANNGTTRGFCSRCGSSLTFQTPSHPDIIEIAVATLDSHIDFEPDVHIFTDSGANWYEPSDGLPCHASGRDSPRKNK